MMTQQRRYELDWLRVLAFLLLIFFHAGMPFVTFNWHIKNADTSVGLSYFWAFLHNWRMPLLFMVSGFGIWFASARCSIGEFFKQRCIRLLIPLVFGVLFIVPPQVYLEKLAQGANFDSYLSFYPHFFDGHAFAGGNFTPNHLWYIYTLFFCTVLVLPLLRYFKSMSAQSSLDKLGEILSAPYGVYLLMLPIYFSLVLLKSYGMEYVFEFSQLSLVIAGVIIASRDVIMQAIEAQRWQFLCYAIAGVAVSLYTEYSPTRFADWIFYMSNVIGYFSLLLAIFGFAKKHLNYNNAFLAYTNEAVYPFYILHQTITVILAYHIVQWEINLWFKFILTTVGTALFSLIIYHYAIRPFNIIRPLFGMKQYQSTLPKNRLPPVGEGANLV